MKRILFTILVCFTLAASAQAQCALCKSTAESSLQEGSTDARGLNMGIMYLLIMPYALVGGIGYWWYSQKKKAARQNGEL